ncbi:hypothetical protein [Thermococcus thioreducens]|uniref:Uncharacterized protein n=1 Tax=Thermococcus thioreducens TaxID=277988 RepID=A0A0Q2QTI0_9EURY|nr:hypothetical protein [Thermococcus thioreducens]ASJ13268.1 hypothetical protein A3L14_10410 [Thermococcus thioreducens]KQH83317.1 hypothetical protein AMR53_01200 [Thermococcus thioreducens]SEW21807.1 hypothetical protein SAMN05216170_2184 [Thermococcus thioreducens]
MNFRAVKLAVVLPAIILTSLAYSDVFRPGDYLLAAAIGIILLGTFLSRGSASGTVFLSTVLYAVPYSIALSQFLPIAFPEAYRNLSEAILASPYFSSPLAIFALMALSILADYVDTAEAWENVLRGLGWRGAGGKTLLYGLPVVLLAFALSLGLLWLGKSLGLSTAGILLPVFLLVLGVAMAYSSIESGSYRRVIVAVEVPPLNGEVVIETPDGSRIMPLSRSSAFEWDTLRLEAELKRRPKRVVLRAGDRSELLTPLIESADGETLFLLYRKKGGEG